MKRQLSSNEEKPIFAPDSKKPSVDPANAYDEEEDEGTGVGVGVGVGGEGRLTDFLTKESLSRWHEHLNEREIALDKIEEGLDRREEVLISRESDAADSGCIPRDKVFNRNIEVFKTDLRTLKLMSWNICGIRAEGRIAKLRNLVESEKPDVLCIQEHKLPSSEQNKTKFNIDGYSSYWVEAKSSSSGVAIYVKDVSIPNRGVVVSFGSGGGGNALSASSGSSSTKSGGGIASNLSVLTGSSDVFIRSVSYEFDGFPGQVPSEFKGEGRAITLDLNLFYVVGCYVPNSGYPKLERLASRVDSWEPFVRKYLDSLRSIKPVIYLGDLNVGHLDLDIYDPSKKTLAKQPSTTPRERSAMTSLLQSGYTDAFRFLYPNARGNFTYWNPISKGRPQNRGYRFDYFLVSNNMLGSVQCESSSPEEAKLFSKIPVPGLLDSYVCSPRSTEDGSKVHSDHCPIALIIKI